MPEKTIDRRARLGVEYVQGVVPGRRMAVWCWKETKIGRGRKCESLAEFSREEIKKRKDQLIKSQKRMVRQRYGPQDARPRHSDGDDDPCLQKPEYQNFMEALTSAWNGYDAPKRRRRLPSSTSGVYGLINKAQNSSISSST